MRFEIKWSRRVAAGAEPRRGWSSPRRATFAIFVLLTGFKLRARTALLTALHLMNYSEFGLIVTAVAVSNRWLGEQWLIVLAIAVSLTFAIATLPAELAPALPCS